MTAHRRLSGKQPPSRLVCKPKPSSPRKHKIKSIVRNSVKKICGRSAYAIFLSENYQTVLASLQGSAAILVCRPQRAVIKTVASQWNGMSDEEKGKWRQREQEERAMKPVTAPMGFNLKSLWLPTEADRKAASRVAGGETSRGVDSGVISKVASDVVGSSGSAADGKAGVTVFGEFRVANQCVGEGSYGIVCEVVHRRLHYRAAAKLLKDKESYSLEVKVYQALQEGPSRPGKECFLHVICCSGDHTPVKWIVLPLCQGSLSARLRATDKLTEAAKTAAVQQLHCGLSYLHSCKWLHGDVKTANVLWSDFSMLAWIVDFGCAKAVVQGRYYTGEEFYTANYRAPELWNKTSRGPSLASEAWAFGCCLAEVWSGRVLFCPVKGYGQHQGPGPIIRDYVKVQIQKHHTGGFHRSAEAQADKPTSWERSWERELQALPDFIRTRAAAYLHPDPELRRKLNRVESFVSHRLEGTRR